jgi:hypothetical protein
LNARRIGAARPDVESISESISRRSGTFRWGSGCFPSAAHAEEAAMLFWPVVIALGPGFAALYYDHDVKSFADQNTCEQTLPQLEQRAKEAKDFMSALTDAAGDKASEVVFQLACIDKTPEEFQHELHSMQDQGDDGSDI